MLLREYYYNRFRQFRKNLKDLLINNNIQTAKNNINTIIEENDRYVQSTNPSDVTANTDNQSLHHAQDHIQYADNEQEQKDAAIRALDEI